MHLPSALSQIALRRLVYEQKYAEAYRYLLALNASSRTTRIKSDKIYIKPVLHHLPHLPNAFHSTIFFNWLQLLPTYEELSRPRPSQSRGHGFQHPRFSRHFYTEGDPTTLLPVVVKWAATAAQKGYIHNIWTEWWAWIVRLVSEKTGVELGMELVQNAVDYELERGLPSKALRARSSPTFQEDEMLTPLRISLSPVSTRILHAYTCLLQGCRLAGQKWEAELERRLVERQAQCSSNEEKMALDVTLRRIRTQD
ncbi:hypothetical protein VNI00_008383 [Paramarasmius palmivorus]|uniref:Uncharacterized protein n=1 Tax=Paramarasmius palmivorus TaxID=297713 RepID=A0AAW0CXC4_9AGAR